MSLDLDRVFIAPTSDKYLEGYEDIYSQHSSLANTALSSARRLLVVGYGFGDVHLEEMLLKTMKSSIPSVVVTRTISDRLRQLAYNSPSTLVIGKGRSGDDATALLAGGVDPGELQIPGRLWNLDVLMQEALGDA
jgi:NAD(P)H-hydrate repair Nnr-like enzyme with NAD(P)H-hydrate dehydratase domain